MVIPISYNTVYYLSPYLFKELLEIYSNWCTVAIYYHFSPVFDECRIDNQQLIFYVEIHTDGHSQFILHMELNLEGKTLYKFLYVTSTSDINLYLL
jgi:hypothetical protein